MASPTTVNMSIAQEDNQSTSAVSNIPSENSRITWTFLGEDIPKAEVQYLCQVLITFVVIVTCLVNMSLSHGHSETWVSFLGYSLGTLLPPPKLHNWSHRSKQRNP